MSLTRDLITVPGLNFVCVSFVGPELPQKNEQIAMKIRGAFGTLGEAQEHAKKLQSADASVDTWVMEMYNWAPVPPKTSDMSDVNYPDAKLNEIFTEYRKNQSLSAAMFEKRKKDMAAISNGTELPFIEPGDENSKFYTKPDVPPVPHPADLIDDLKLEFPDKTMLELVKIADKRVQEEVSRRVALSVGQLDTESVKE